MDIEFEYFDEKRDRNLLVTASVQKYDDFGGYYEVDGICIAVESDMKDITDRVQKERPELYKAITELCEGEHDVAYQDEYEAAMEARAESAQDR